MAEVTQVKKIPKRNRSKVDAAMKASLNSLSVRIDTLESEVKSYKVLTEELTRQLVAYKEKQPLPTENKNGDIDIEAANLAQMEAMFGESNTETNLKSDSESEIVTIIESESETPPRKGYTKFLFAGLALLVVAGFLVYMVATGRMG
jgi:hypothetical protein